MSNSIILTNLLSDENNKFSTDVQNVLDDKLNEFKEIIKKHVSECVTENISNFYNQPNSEFEDEIFDKLFPNQLDLSFNVRKTQYANYQIYHNKKYFIVTCRLHNYFIFENGNILIEIISPNINCHPCSYYYRELKYNLPLHVLYIIKNISLFINRDHTVDFEQVMDKLCRLDKNKFYLNSIEFEKICKTEYSNIKNIKYELQEKQTVLNNLIQTQKDNAKYYNDLELKFKEFEKEKQLFEENKKKLLIAKQKINEMEKNLQKEKLLFEKEKQEFYQTSETINLDDFLIENE